MRSHLALSFLCILFTAASLPAQQQNTPRIGFVYPAGGRQGSTVEITLGGQYLDGVSKAYVSGTGVTASIVEHVKPLNPRDFQLLQDKQRELLEKRAASRGTSATRPTWTAEDEKALAEVRAKLATFVRRPSSPAIAESVTVQLKLTPDAPPGQRELRLACQRGLTNPLPFYVDQLPEFSEKPTARAGEATTGVMANEMSITLPAIVNGQIGPGGVDRARFTASKGQQLVAVVNARSLIPYIADAVPGWFQAVLTLRDSKGREIAFADDRFFNPDPVLYCRIPEDGQYTLEIRDAIYRGREDFVYRITIGELPYITGIFPLGGPANASTTVQLSGWNLPVSTLTPSARWAGLRSIFVERGGLISNQAPFAVDTLPERPEQEPNNRRDAAQAVAMPVIVNGRIDQPGDVDMYRIEGRQGAQIVAEVMARRLNSPLDSVLTLTDDSGRQLALNDDHEDKAAGLLTHHADSMLQFSLPADGTYFVCLGDTQNKGGSEYAYRLRISAPRPDFELRVVPSSVTIRPGSGASLTVYALRRDGYAGEIELSLKDAPAGFSLSGKIPADKDQAKLTLNGPRDGSGRVLSLTVQGKGRSQGRELVKVAVPADDMMQAFAYRHLVPARELMVLVQERGLWGALRR